MRLIAALLFSACLAGCASSAKMSVEDAAADYGSYPVAFENRIKTKMGETLKDPYSAVYEFELPVKAKAWRGLINGGGYVYGWCIPFTVNAKNSFGGYVGAESYQAFIKYGELWIEQPGSSVITILN